MQEPCNPNFFNGSTTFTIGDKTFTGDDLNFAARVIYGEAAGSAGGGTDDERDAMASILYNRIGVSGFRGGVQTTFEGAALQTNAFQAVTGAERNTRKFRNAEIVNGTYRSLDPAECADFRKSLEAIERLINNGSRYGYTYNRPAEGRSDGVQIGGSRFYDYLPPD